MFLALGQSSAVSGLLFRLLFVKLWFIAQNDTETYKMRLIESKILFVKEQELLASMSAAYSTTLKKQCWYKILLVKRFSFLIFHVI